MRRYRKKKEKSIKSLNAGQLRALIRESKSNLQDAQEEIERLKPKREIAEILELHQFKEKLENLNQIKVEIYQRYYEKRSLWAKLKSKTYDAISLEEIWGCIPPREYFEEIREVDLQMAEIIKQYPEYPDIFESDYRFLHDAFDLAQFKQNFTEKKGPFIADITLQITTYLNDWKNLGAKKRMCEEKLKAEEEQLSILVKKEANKEKEKKRKQRQGAIVASYTDKSRQAAEQVKRQLQIDKNCPYCDKRIGETPHADHIYPIARGGLSVDENMIYVCAECNRKKSDMTLREFIKKFDLNRGAIERKLERLGKTF
jgi:5-methylcytosine-specific restriction endonuclease McrA